MTMVKSYVKESTATQGTGDLSLDPITGFARFLSAETFTANSAVIYAIENGDKKETGIGTIRAGNILERTTPLTTLNAGIYDASSPSPLNLVGSSIVFCDLNASASSTIDGYLTKEDWITFNSKETAGAAAASMAAHVAAFDPHTQYVHTTGDSMTGALMLANLSNAINTGAYVFNLESGVIDGASAVGFNLKTANTLSNTTARILTVKNNTTESLTLMASGNFGLGLGGVDPIGRLDIKGAPNVVALIFTPGDALTNTVRFNNFNGNEIGSIDALARAYLGAVYAGNNPSATIPDTGLYISHNVVPNAYMDFYGTSNNVFRFRKARGTSGFPAQVPVNDNLGLFQFAGYGTTKFASNTALIGAYAAENYTDTANGSYIKINTTPIGSITSAEVVRFDSTGNVGIGVTSPTAHLHISAGTATANRAPLKFNSGALLTTAEAGAIEFLTDDLYFTITTGAARKSVILNDGLNLTSGRIPFATTNGRLTDVSNFTFSSNVLTAPLIISTDRIRLKNYTVNTLPAGTQGDKAFVTDALGPTYLVPVVGGGAVVTEVFYNGATWVCT